MVGDAARIKQTLYHLVIAALKTTEGEVVAVIVTREGTGVIFAVRYAATHDSRTPALSIHLAQRIAARISEVEGTDIPVGSLDVTMYRDAVKTGGFEGRIEVKEIVELLEEALAA